MRRAHVFLQELVLNTCYCAQSLAWVKSLGSQHIFELNALIYKQSTQEIFDIITPLRKDGFKRVYGKPSAVYQECI